MAAYDVAVEERPTASSVDPVINDFSIQVATVNGSGSQTANLVLLRAIFQMGVPVSGRTSFPRTSRGCPRGSPSGPTRRGTSPARRRSTFSSR